MSLTPIPDVSTVKPTPAEAPAHPYRLAYVIDGLVVMTLNTDGRTAAVVTSNPTIVQVDPAGPISEGWTYDGKDFAYPHAATPSVTSAS
jgi:hypothetical protein